MIAILVVLWVSIDVRHYWCASILVFTGTVIIQLVTYWHYVVISVSYRLTEVTLVSSVAWLLEEPF